MDEEKYQKELFEFEKPKRFFPRLSDFFPKADFERNVVFTLTLDKVVFIAIGIIMVMVVIYALGVEAGKSRAADNAEPPAAAAVPQPSKITPVPVPAALPAQRAFVQNQPIRNTAPAMPISKIPPAQTPATNAAKPYTIVAATFTRRDNALQEMDKLKKQGFTAILVQSDSYFQVCIGAYSKSDAQAQKDLSRVKRLYKDAYLKLK